MKPKFSIFSPSSPNTQPVQSSINFKKSPNKFAVYQPDNKPKQIPKYSAYQSLSSTNMEHLKKLPHELSNLRQTLNFKFNDLQAYMQQDETEKVSKSSNILKSTFHIKPSLKQRSQKLFSQSFSGHDFNSNDFYQKSQPIPSLGYSKVSNPSLGQSKSLSMLYDPRQVDKKYNELNEEEKTKEWRQTIGKMKSEQGLKSLYDSKHSKITQQIKILKRIAANNQQEQFKQPKIKTTVQRKYSLNQNYHQYSPELQQSIFRKKIREKEQQPQEIHTPKHPKYSYEERFKKVGSPTSTNNSESRSPPNKFIQIAQIKKKSGKVDIDDLVIGKILGQGKFGVVMIATHKKSGALIALKKIPKAMIKSHFMIDQLTLQIKLQSCLNHKNILSMYGFFDDATHLYIILEYMEQGTLYSQLKKNRILSEGQSAMIIKQIAEAIDYLHDHDIAHRDIKPQNIVISNNVYKLCDFGWATLCNERRKTYCGTFDYAAPEILQGKEYDMTVDLWCLGVLTYELLTGKAPFYHLSRKQTMKRILNVQTDSITFPESMSSQAVDFIQKLVRKNPIERMKASDALKHPFLINAEDL